MGQINWYIGHMEKSFQVIKNQIKNADIVIQVCDARSIRTTTNPELIKLAGNKPVINVALKSDLADLKSIKNTDNLILTNIHNKNFTNQFKNQIHHLLEKRIKKLQAQGLVNPTFYLIILGLPNVGKSSLINKLRMKKIADVQNTPGVTRNVKLFKLTNNLLIYDTPGIMHKKIDQVQDGYILGTLGCISERVLPINEVVNFNCDFYFKYYESQIRKYFNYHEPYDYQQFLEYIGHQYQLITTNCEINYQRVYQYLFNIFNKGKICPVNYDQEN